MTSEQKKVAVIGGGISGMTASITAARLGHQVTLYEHKPILGKKIFVTGNGKCNFYNDEQGIEHYHGSSPDFAVKVFENSGLSTLEFLMGLGIWPIEKNGYYYPYSQEAVRVQEAFVLELKRFKVALCFAKVNHIEHGNVFTVSGKLQPAQADQKWQPFEENYDAVILSCGGNAAPETGSDGSGYYLAKQLNLPMAEPLPALVPLVCEEDYCKELAGLRMPGIVSLSADGEFLRSQKGEIQFTDYGISGIAVFNLSGYANRALQDGKSVGIHCDLLPDVPAFESFFASLTPTQKENLLPKKLAGIMENPSTTEDMIHFLRHLSFTVTGSKGFAHAQTTSGGILTDAIYADSMESKKIPGLYFAGELVDIDGDCGGYNINWAIQSGILAGQLK